jgi:uncharacterized protein YegL
MGDIMTKPTSLVTFLLDKSSSMSICLDATIEGFNGYLATLQAEADADIDFTFLQFDTFSLDKVCVAMPVRDVRKLSRETYQPRGGTPLIDAAVKTIRAVEASLSSRSDKPRVVVCIQTDGEENSSRDHTWEELRTLIAAKTEQGWEFNFLGAGIDAYSQGARMGIAAMNTMSYDNTNLGSTREAFTASAMNASGYAAGRIATSAYSGEQRSASGDRFAGAHGLPAAGVTPAAVLDLTTKIAMMPMATAVIPPSARSAVLDLTRP